MNFALLDARRWLGKVFLATASVVFLATTMPLHGQADDNRPRVLVAFTDAVAQHDTVTLSWDTYAECQPDQFADYTGALEFIVSVGDKRVLTHERFYTFPGVDFGKSYACRVQIQSPFVEDITDDVNRTLGGDHGYGQYTIRFHERRVSVNYFGWVTPVLDQVWEFGDATKMIFHESMFVFVCLLVITCAGGFLMFTFGWKLFKRKRVRPAVIRSTWREYREMSLSEAIDKIEAARRAGNMSPTLGILANGINRWKREVIFPSGTIEYLVPPRPNGRALHFTKVERIQRALYDRIQTHYTNLSNLTFPRGFQKFEEDEPGLLGQKALQLGQTLRGGRVWNFFFSIEYFWNFGVIAPMFGLLGTVMGIAGAFGEIGLTSNGSMIENLSGGIHEALHTTIGGLIVGLPFLLVYYLLSWRINTIRDAWHGVADEFVRKVENEMVSQRETFEKTGLGI